MADSQSIPPSVVSLLGDIVGALAAILQRLGEVETKIADLQNRDGEKDAQIAELQGDRTTLLESAEQMKASITELQSHAESVAGEAGVISQFGDLAQIPALQQRLATAMPTPAAAPLSAAA